MLVGAPGALDDLPEPPRRQGVVVPAPGPEHALVGDVAQQQKTTMVTRAVEDPRFAPEADPSSQTLAQNVMATAMVAGGVTVGAIQVTNKVTGDGIFDERDRELLEGLAAVAAISLRSAQLHAAEKRAGDLALLLDISREITATLDLDRVLQSVVNLASRALPFDRAAVALYEKGRCDVRAVAGEETVDPKDPKLQDLVARAEWAAGRGQPLYLSERVAPGSDAERMFVTIFGQDLESDRVESGLYLPLKDEEGIVGILLFEAARSDFATPRERDLAAILANQSTVAVRNARLYRQVPLASAIGAISAKKAAWFELPAQRRRIYLAAAAVAIAALTALLSFVHFDDRPADIRLLASRTQASLWGAPRWEALGAHGRRGRDDPRAFRALEELVPAATVLAYAVGPDEYLYPAFDARLRRTVRFVDPGARVPTDAAWAMVGPGGRALGCRESWLRVAVPAPGWRLSRRVRQDGACLATEPL